MPAPSAPAAGAAGPGEDVPGAAGPGAAGTGEAGPGEAGPGTGEAGTGAAGPGGRPRRLVAAAAILDDLAAPTRMLAARRSAPPELAGQWELPGGKVEPGEGATQALHRELSEELGVTVALGERVVGPADGDWPILRGLTMRVWLATITTGEPQPLLDHDELRWVERAAWRELPWLEPDRPILEAILALRP